MRFSSSDITAAVKRLRSGGVVAFPTETVYGLGADAMNAEAVRQVFLLKGRPSNNPLIVHVTGPEMAAKIGVWESETDDRAARLARAFWPGPLTIVIPRREVILDEIIGGAAVGGRGTVAVRSPSHPAALALLFEFDGPLVGPSANRSGMVSPTRAEHVREVWADDQVMVLDGGPCTGGIESTVVSVAEAETRVLRPGLIGPDELSRELGSPVVFGADVPTETGGALPAPGMLARHYAPATRSELVEIADVSALLRNMTTGQRAVVLAISPLKLSAPHTLMAMPQTAPDYAAELYNALRRADAMNCDAILIERPNGAGDAHIWAAIRDRLGRATSV